MPILKISKTLSDMVMHSVGDCVYSTRPGKWTVVRMHLILFQRDECELCDRALHLLAQARLPDFSSVWIDDDVALEAEYGARVPVLRDDASGRELDWPFDEATLRAFVAAGDLLD